MLGCPLPCPFPKQRQRRLGLQDADAAPRVEHQQIPVVGNDDGRLRALRRCQRRFEHHIVTGVAALRHALGRSDRLRLGYRPGDERFPDNDAV